MYLYDRGQAFAAIIHFDGYESAMAAWHNDLRYHQQGAMVIGQAQILLSTVFLLVWFVSIISLRSNPEFSGRLLDFGSNRLDTVTDTALLWSCRGLLKRCWSCLWSHWVCRGVDLMGHFQRSQWSAPKFRTISSDRLTESSS